MLPWKLEFQFDQPQNFMQPFPPHLIMLHIKFDQDWPACIKDILNLKLWTDDNGRRRTTDDRALAH